MKSDLIQKLKTNFEFSCCNFYSDRKDQQVLISTQVDPNDPNTFTFLTQNAAEGTNNGIELEMDFELSENLDMFFNFGLLKTEIKSWKSRPELGKQAHAPEKSYAIGSIGTLQNSQVYHLISW